ncbi:hypothetical protein ACFYXC_37890 [Streptomyces sp. NPDC002701]|uniref:hypothetical protein n=1 Tax=Streptomyces sp. NPDC002701 TaxID=3364661 RepID=UPI0036B676C9
MKRKVGYTWKLRELMGTHGMFTTTEPVPLLRDRGIELSATQVLRPVRIGPWEQQEATGQFEAQYAALLRRTRLSGRRVCYGSENSVARNSFTAPWGIYPLQPAQCAGLIADMLVFTVTMSADNFVEELRRAGLNARWILPKASRSDRSSPSWRSTGTATGYGWGAPTSNACC